MTEDILIHQLMFIAGACSHQVSKAMAHSRALIVYLGSGVLIPMHHE